MIKSEKENNKIIFFPVESYIDDSLVSNKHSLLKKRRI